MFCKPFRKFRTLFLLSERDIVMKRSKKIIGALFVSAVVVGSSLTAFASNWHSAATADAVLKNNYSLAVAITDCSRVPCTEFIGIESTITGQGDDFSETGVGSSGVPTCQVFASTNDVRGFTSAHSTHHFTIAFNGHYEYFDTAKHAYR